MSTPPKVEKTEQTEPTMNNAQIKLQVEKANKILNGFVPPLKGGWLIVGYFFVGWKNNDQLR